MKEMRMKKRFQVLTVFLACILLLAPSLQSHAEEPGGANTATEAPGDTKLQEEEKPDGKEQAEQPEETKTERDESLEDAEEESSEETDPEKSVSGPNVQPGQDSGGPGASEELPENPDESGESPSSPSSGETSPENPSGAETSPGDESSPGQDSESPSVTPDRTEEIVKPETVKGLSVTAEGYNTLLLTWDEAADVTGYEIYYASDGNTEYRLLKALTGNSYRFTEAECGKVYYFRVRGFRQEEKGIVQGEFTEAVSGITALATPELYAEKVTYNSITLKWTEVTGALRYRVLVAEAGKDTFEELAVVESSSYTHRNVELEKEYRYKIVAFRPECESGESNVLSVVPRLETLSGLSAVGISTSSIRVSWKRVTGIESYTVVRYETKKDAIDGTNPKYTKTVSGSTFTDIDLRDDTTYYYTLYGTYNGQKTEIIGPVWAKTKKISESSSSDDSSVHYGVDVSEYQGDVNWNAVADSGIDFAMVRILKKGGAKDSKFERNYENARAAGIKVGVYRYSYAQSVAEAEQEAREVVAALGGRKLDYPVALDMEDKSQYWISPSVKAEMILAYKRIIEAAGYKFVLYANTDWLTNRIETSRLSGVDIWIARWRSLDSGHGYNGPGNVTMWQYSDAGRIPGISGNVDLNVSYKNY